MWPTEGGQVPNGAVETPSLACQHGPEGEGGRHQEAGCGTPASTHILDLLPGDRHSGRTLAGGGPAFKAEAPPPPTVMAFLGLLLLFS